MNRRIVLAERPQPTATSAAFRLETAPIPELSAGEVLVRTLWLSLDPYMRGRMSDAPSYAAPVAVGGVMTGQTVSRVESSRNPAYRTGDLVLAESGWQEYAVSDGRDLKAVPPGLTRLSWALGVLGMTGFTAYKGLLDIGKREDIVRGLENAPRAFLGLLEGRNFGKLVVSLDEPQGVGA